MSADLFDFDMERERKRTKTINAKKYTFYASDPYGLWTISYSDFGTERELPGQYTNLKEAEKAATIHSLPKPKEVKSSGFKSELKKE